MDERASRPQRLVLRALILPPLTQRAGLLPVISDPGLTLVPGGEKQWAADSLSLYLSNHL